MLLNDSSIWMSSHYLTIAIELSPVVGTAVLAYRSLYWLTSNKCVALAATCMTFSSVVSIWYYDMISNGFGMGIFGSMLVFHGMVIFALKGRFYQLAIKSCLALLLSWHVLTLLVPFIAIGLFKESSTRNNNCTKIGLRCLLLKVRMSIAAVVTSRYMILGIIVVVFSILVLIYIGLDLPVLESMTRRLIMNLESSQVIADQVELPSFLRDQLINIGLISIPYAMPGYSSTPTWWKGGDLLGVSELQNLFIGIVVVGVCVVGMFFVRHRLLTITAVLSGVCWIILWRYNSSIYGHEILYYIGLPLAFFAIIFTLTWRSTSELLMRYISATAVLIFIFSGVQMISIGNSIGNLGRFSAEFHELDRRVDQTVSSGEPVIRDYFDVHWADDGALVYARAPCRSEDVIPSFFLHIYPINAEDLPEHRATTGFDNLVFGFGDRGIIDYQRCAIVVELPDYDIASIRTGQLTDDGDRIWTGIASNPYSAVHADLNLRVDQTVSSGEPVIRDYFDVHWADDGALVYARAPCRSEDVIPSFFLHIYPINAEDLPEHRATTGFDNLVFGFGDRGIIDYQRCAIVVELPDYDIASIRTGQLTDDGDRIWTGEFDLAGG